MGHLKSVPERHWASWGFPGMIIAWLFPGAPKGWLLCDGRTISRRSRLGRLIVKSGCLWGEGDGYKTVNLPDFRGRVLLMGSPGYDGVPFLPGEMGGERTCMLSIEQLPPHSHTFVGPSIAQGVESGFQEALPMGNNAQQTTITGNGQPMSLLQPYAVVSMIIRL